MAVETVRVSLNTDPAVAAVPLADVPPFLKGCSAVWRKQIRIPDRERTVFIGLPARFPDEVPIAYTADGKDLYLKNPHIMNDGFICTIPNSAAINSSDPVGIVRYVFDDCEKILNGTGAADFQDEFTSYWNRSCSLGDQGVLLVDGIKSLKNPFCVGNLNGLLLAASSADKLGQWIANSSGRASELKNIFKGITIHLNSPLLPDGYPSTLAQLVSIAENSDAEASAQIKNHIVDSTESCLVILVQKQGGGVALGGVIFRGLGLSSRAIPGFRAGKVPKDLLLRYTSKEIAASEVMRSRINQADHGWIHSRGGDGRDLSNKSVLVIGSGSLGGYVAHLLARAGVGRLTVTDNDRLGWENLGRHVLGANYVGRWKAEALAEELGRTLPHLKIRGIAKDWRDIYEETPNFFNEYDLVISTVGDWRCERPLNQLIHRIQMPPLCLGWLEPFAVAGHCLMIIPSGGCFECAADEYGRFNYAVAKFDTPPLSKEPGGCTHYQHYGPIALMPVATLISSVAVESLSAGVSNSMLKTWISSKEHFDAVQANISTNWSSEIGQLGFLHTFQRKWDKVPSCAVCSQKNL
jgi:molybdopterin/thiamine biosynthesis adenylyltransferase